MKPLDSQDEKVEYPEVKNKPLDSQDEKVEYPEAKKSLASRIKGKLVNLFYEVPRYSQDQLSENGDGRWDL